GWQRWWLKLAEFGVQWAVWFMAMAITLNFIKSRVQNDFKQDLRNQTVALLTNGIPIEKQGKALELLLAYTFDYHPKTPDLRIPNWCFILFGGGVIYCIALSYKPTIAVAIGRGEEKVKWWRRYSKFILITTPTFVFGTFFWPKLESLLKGLF